MKDQRGKKEKTLTSSWKKWKIGQNSGKSPNSHFPGGHIINTTIWQWCH